MSRKATTKAELLADIQDARQKMEKKYGGLTPAQMVCPCSMGDWSVKDILAHLVDWEQRFIVWYQAGLKGETPQTPAPGKTWRDLPEINHQGYLAHRNESLEEVLANSTSSYDQIMTLVYGMTEEEIFSPKVYPWTGDSSLLGFIAANTSSHYRWAIRNIRTQTIRKSCPDINAKTVNNI